MKTSLQNSVSSKFFSMLGIILPYLVIAFSIFVFAQTIGSIDYESFARLRAWNAITYWLVIFALIIGVALCWPRLRKRLSVSSKKALLIFEFIVGCGMQVAGILLFRTAIDFFLGGVL